MLRHHVLLNIEISFYLAIEGITQASRLKVETNWARPCLIQNPTILAYFLVRIMYKHTRRLRPKFERSDVTRNVKLKNLSENARLVEISIFLLPVRSFECVCVLQVNHKAD